MRAREKPGAYDGTAKKSDGVSNSLICHLDFASWTCSHLSCITVALFFVSMINCQFGGNVAEDPVVNAIGDYNNRRAEELSLPPTTIPMIESTECSQKNCPRMLLTLQFGSNVTEDHAVNAIGDSPIWDALFIKKFENEVAVKVLFESKREARCL